MGEMDAVGKPRSNLGHVIVTMRTQRPRTQRQAVCAGIHRLHDPGNVILVRDGVKSAIYRAICAKRDDDD